MLKKITFTNTFLLLGVGLLLRLFFTLFLAKHYYGLENFYMQGDTGAWAKSFYYWYTTGTYTYDPLSHYGGFVRMPGYSFFLGFFYVLCHEDWLLSFKVVGFVQIAVDVYSIYLVKIIAQKIFNDNKLAYCAAWLYAIYPFAIVWNPVCYSEITSLNLVLLSIWFFLQENNRKTNVFLCATFAALGALMRPQIAIIFPVFGLLILLQKTDLKVKMIHAIVYGLTVALIFGIWPLRNYYSQHELVVTQDLRGSSNWNGEVLAFTSFIYSAQSDWEPQFTQILKNEEVTIPKYFSGTKQDTAKLKLAFNLSKARGVSFSHWKGYWRNTYIQPNACTDSISTLFAELRQSQIQQNPFTFYVTLPILNLKKAIFKSSLYDTDSLARRIASYLFYYRTIMILLGLIGVYFMCKIPTLKTPALLFLFYWLFLYVALCAGTGAMFRNIEIRYFLHCDAALLIPAAYAILYFKNKIMPTK